MRRITATATELARRLDEHPAVERVRYPGFSGLISFDVADPRAVETRTRADHRTRRASAASTRRWRAATAGRATGSRTGLLRLSVGLEDVDELWADLEQALG